MALASPQGEVLLKRVIHGDPSSSEDDIVRQLGGPPAMRVFRPDTRPRFRSSRSALGQVMWQDWSNPRWFGEPGPFSQARFGDHPELRRWLETISRDPHRLPVFADWPEANGVTDPQLLADLRGG